MKDKKANIEMVPNNCLRGKCEALKLKVEGGRGLVLYSRLEFILDVAIAKGDAAVVVVFVVIVFDKIHWVKSTLPDSTSLFVVVKSPPNSASASTSMDDQR